MNLSKKTEAYLIGGFTLGAILSLLVLIGEIILPFVFSIFLAYLLNPIILKIQTKIKNRKLAITSFLFGIALLIVGIVFFLGGQIIKDTKRFVISVEVFMDENEQQINNIKSSVLSFFNQVYENETVQNKIKSAGTLTDDLEEQNLISSLKNVYSFFENSKTKTDEPDRKPWSWFYMLIYTLLYTVIILYTYDYFEEKYVKYFGNSKSNKGKLYRIWQDFEIVFMKYFRQRTKVVLICTSIFIFAFSLLNLPGAILIGIIAGILTYAAHFHYFSLPLTAIGCWVLSVEYDANFFLFFGIVLIIYIIISVLEEAVFFTKIMKSVNGMNSAIMFLAFTLWIYVFGGFIGTFIALPLTQLIMIYLDYLILLSKEKRKLT